MKALATANHADNIFDDGIPNLDTPLAIPATLERKNAGGTPAAAKGEAADLRGVVADLGQVVVQTATRMEQIFEQFKNANDESLQQKAKKGTDDVVTREKVDRINGAIDDAQDRATRLRRETLLKSARPGMGGPQLTPEQKSKNFVREWKAAADLYFRTGDETALRKFQQKAMSAGTNADGGFTVFADKETSILDKLLREISPIRQLASVRSVSSNLYTKPVGIGGAATGWVGETAARTTTATSQLALLQFPVAELYANPAITQQLLDDSATNIEQWHAEEVSEVMAQQENAAFVAGDGTNKPKGFLAYTTVANASWTNNNIGYIATGVAGAFSASNPQDILIDLTMAVKAGYRGNAQFVMNRATLGTARKFKDTAGQYLWQPSYQEGTPGKLAGYGVVEAEDMPSIAANSLSIAFGDFKRGYLIVDRLGISVLRDPYTNKPYIHFYTTKRVGGGMQNFEAIKFLKFAAS